MRLGFGGALAIIGEHWVFEGRAAANQGPGERICIGSKGGSAYRAGLVSCLGKRWAGGGPCNSI